MIYLFIAVCLFLLLSDIADTEISLKIQHDLGYVESNPLYGKGTQPSRLKFYAVSMTLNALLILSSWVCFRYLTLYVPLWAIAPLVWGIKHLIAARTSYKILKDAGK